VLLPCSEYGSSPEDTLILDWSVDLDLVKMLANFERKGLERSGVGLTSSQMIMQTN